MQIFKSPFKSSSSKGPNQDPSSSGSGSAVRDTIQMTADEMRALVQSQQEAIGHLQARLGGLAVGERNTVPDLNVAAVEQFLGGDRVASWMRQSGEALRDYVRSAECASVRLSDVMGNTMECPRGDRLAYRLLGIILDLQHVCAQRYLSDDISRGDPANAVDALSWSEAV